MEIIIHDSYKLCEIQKEFSEHFPYLKLEFFGFEPTEQKIFLRENLITDTNKTVAEIRHLHLMGHISINAQQKVSTLEQHFKKNFGINIQVFRKSGNTWLLTTTTDDWTLAEQNKKGEEMNNAVKEEATDNYDQYHEQI